MDSELKAKYMHIAISNIINDLRADKHLTQEILGSEANLNRSHVTMIENANKFPTIPTLIKLCDAMEMPLSSLIKMAEDVIDALPEDDPETAFRALMAERSRLRILKHHPNKGKSRRKKRVGTKKDETKKDEIKKDKE